MWEPKEILKMYNYVNDEKRSRVNVKFLGFFGALTLALAAMIAFAVTLSNTADGPWGADGSPADSRSQSEYVGLTRSETESLSYDPAQPGARFADWRAAHPGATVERMEPVYYDGRLAGYTLTYHE